MRLPAGSESWGAEPMPGRSVPRHPAQAWQKMPPAGAAGRHRPALVSLAWEALFLNQFPNDGQVFDPNLRLYPHTAAVNELIRILPLWVCLLDDG